MNPPTSPTLKDLAEAAGIPYKTVFIRIKRGWSQEKALSTPANAPIKPKILTKSQITIDNVDTLLPKSPSDFKDAFEVCYGTKFVPGRNSPPWH